MKDLDINEAETSGQINEIVIQNQTRDLAVVNSHPKPAILQEGNSPFEPIEISCDSLDMLATMAEHNNFNLQDSLNFLASTRKLIGLLKRWVAEFSSNTIGSNRFYSFETEHIQLRIQEIDEELFNLRTSYNQIIIQLIAI